MVQIRPEKTFKISPKTVCTGYVKETALFLCVASVLQGPNSNGHMEILRCSFIRCASVECCVFSKPVLSAL